MSGQVAGCESLSHVLAISESLTDVDLSKNLFYDAGTHRLAMTT